jgi:hypothetical protein
MARPFLTVLGLGALAAALIGLVGFALVPTWRGHAARSWPETPCTITAKEIVETEHADGKRSVEARLQYRYAVGGREHAGWRYDFSPTRDGRAPERDVRHLWPGQQVSCRYDPDDPSDAVLVPRGWPGFAAPLFLGLAIGALVLVAAGLGSNPGRRTRTVRLSDGRVRIRARGQFLLLVVAAGAVVAITAPIAWLALEQHDGAISAGFLVLSLVLVLRWLHIAGAYATRLDLVLDRTSLRPGESMAVRWQVRAPIPPRASRARLIATEEVEYVVDDSPDSEQRVVVERPLGPGLELPDDAMPTLAVGRCRLRWSIAVNADIRGWPDLAVEVPIEVLPAPAGEPLRGVLRHDGAVDEIQLRWCATSAHGSHETVVERQVVEKPADEGGSPYRAAGPPSYRFAAPAHPPAYQGTLFRIDWRVVLVADGKDVHALDVPVRMAR